MVGGVACSLVSSEAFTDAIVIWGNGPRVRVYCLFGEDAIIGDDNSVTGGIIGATSLLAINYLVVRFLYNHRKLDQLVEGKADVLIENGKVRTEHLKRELITMQQLSAAARKQGFDDLSEVQQCVLEPGGTLTFIARKPDTEDVRHRELLNRFEMLTEELARLRKGQPPATA